MATMETQIQPPPQAKTTAFKSNAAVMSETGVTNPNQRFYRHFLDSVAVLQDQIDQLQSVAAVPGERQEAIDHILASIGKLQNEVADASDFTPSYDRKQYSEAIKTLQEKLNDTIAKVTPKSRFQFKRTNKSKYVDMGAPENDPRLNPGSHAIHPHTSLKETSALPVAAAREVDALSELPDSKGRDYNEEMARASESSIRKPSFSAARSVAITDQSGLHIILPSSATHATAAGSLTNLNRCVVDLSIPTAAGAPFPGLALKNIHNSLIVAGRVDGPVHITGITNSILVVAARQVRIHECSNVDIYLRCSSHPIIEDCSGMRFAPLPLVYAKESDKTSENQWDQVDDFKWLKAGHSPNWTTLQEAERIDDEKWRHVVPGQPGVSVQETLEKMGITPK